MSDRRVHTAIVGVLLTSLTLACGTAATPEARTAPTSTTGPATTSASDAIANPVATSATTATLPPDPTPEVTEALPPTATAPGSGDTGGELVFMDDFSRAPCIWYESEEEQTSIGCADGGYRISIRDYVGTVLGGPGGVSGSDLRVEVDATTTGGSDDNGLGVVCRMEDPRNFYQFVITAKGAYGIGQVKDDKWEWLAESSGEKSDVIHKGKETNHIRVDCVGESLTLFVNGEKLLDAQNGNFRSGQLALLGKANDKQGTHILFDNFVVYGKGRYVPTAEVSPSTSFVVTYRLVGTVKTALVVYDVFEGGERREVVEEVAVPWEKAIQMPAGKKAVLTATSSEDAGRLGCQVLVGDEVVDDEELAPFKANSILSCSTGSR